MHADHDPVSASSTPEVPAAAEGAAEASAHQVPDADPGKKEKKDKQQRKDKKDKRREKGKGGKSSKDKARKRKDNRTPEQILEHARAAEAAGAHRFCMVTQGQGLSRRDFAKIVEGARLVAEHTKVTEAATAPETDDG